MDRLVAERGIPENEALALAIHQERQNEELRRVAQKCRSNVDRIIFMNRWQHVLSTNMLTKSPKSVAFAVFFLSDYLKSFRQISSDTFREHESTFEQVKNFLGETNGGWSIMQQGTLPFLVGFEDANDAFWFKMKFL